MNKLQKIILWSSIVIVIILIAFMSIPLFFKRSWWWFFIPLIITFVLGIGFLIFFLIRKRNIESKTEKESLIMKGKEINEKEASELVNNIMTYEYADYLVDTEEAETHEGIAGKPRTPVFHKFGKGYYEDRWYHFLVNLNNPKQIDKFVQKSGENDEKFKKRITESISKFAPEPEIFETEEIERETAEGRVKTTRKKQTRVELEKEAQEQEKEEIEEI